MLFWKKPRRRRRSTTTMESTVQLQPAREGDVRFWQFVERTLSGLADEIKAWCQGH